MSIRYFIYTLFFAKCTIHREKLVHYYKTSLLLLHLTHLHSYIIIDTWIAFLHTQTFGEGEHMAGKVTIQDIADALGLSRNTVSKAINNTGILAENTRERILRKAVEMGYKQFSYINISETGGARLALTEGEKQIPAEQRGVISMLTAHMFDSSHFASPMLDVMQRKLSEHGYSFMIHRVTEDLIRKKQLPPSVNTDLTIALLCIEVFDMEYARYLCSLGIPTLFVDAPADSLREKLNTDILIMDNRVSVVSFVCNMISRGLTKIGYIGDITHCRSFYERYLAMQDGLMIAGQSPDERYSIWQNPDGKAYHDAQLYRSFLTDALKNMKELPDIFLCANDFVAIDTLAAFDAVGIRVPEDVFLCGFDDSPESRVLTPRLSTIHIHSHAMGLAAVNLLLSRTSQPDLNFRTVVTETSLILRESTGDGRSGSPRK